MIYKIIIIALFSLLLTACGNNNISDITVLENFKYLDTVKLNNIENELIIFKDFTYFCYKL